jgi:hypothetical protein
MSTRKEKEQVKVEAESLLQKAEGCFDTADIQHEGAKKLEESADKLETIGEVLTAKAVELKGELALDTERNSPPLIINKI